MCIRDSYWYHAERDAAAELIRIQNEGLAEICAANSDRFVAFATIALLAEHAGDRAVVGAGTVLDTGAVARLAEIGAQMVVSPDACAEVIAATKAAGMLSYPGVMTPTECFAALRAGADGIKLFPASKMGLDGLAAVKSVLPVGTKTYAVGGVGPANFADWQAAGITGFGIGSGIYKIGFSADEVASQARDIVAAYDAVF